MSRLFSLEDNSIAYHPSTFNTTTTNYNDIKVIYSDEFWIGFERFLSQTNNHRSTKDRFNYARHYVRILQTEDARDLLELKDDKRLHSMKSLSALAKYTGHYDKWK